MPYKWVVPGDPENREFEDEGTAMARAWSITPAGGKRPTPKSIQVAYVGAEIDLADALLDGFDILNDVGSYEENGQVRLGVKARITAESDWDFDRDVVLVRKKLIGNLRKTATARGLLLVRDSLKVRVEKLEDGTTEIIAQCQAVEDGIDDETKEKIATTLPPPPFVADWVRSSGFGSGSAPEPDATREHADKYRKMKKALKRGVITPEEMERSIERWMREGTVE